MNRSVIEQKPSVKSVPDFDDTFHNNAKSKLIEEREASEEIINERIQQFWAPNPSFDYDPSFYEWISAKKKQCELLRSRILLLQNSRIQQHEGEEIETIDTTEEIGENDINALKLCLKEAQAFSQKYHLDQFNFELTTSNLKQKIEELNSKLIPDAMRSYQIELSTQNRYKMELQKLQ